MSTLTQVVNQLRTERKKVQQELSRLDAAIDALQGLSSSSGTSRTTSQKPRRTMSAAARRRIAAAQRARWAAWKAKQKKAA
jgi:hypothetical protein